MSYAPCINERGNRVMPNYWRVVFDRDGWTKAVSSGYEVVGLPDKAGEAAAGVQIGDILLCCIRQYGAGATKIPSQYTGALQVTRAANKKSGSVRIYGRGYPIGIGTRPLAILDEDDRFNVRAAVLGDESDAPAAGPKRLRGTLRFLTDSAEALSVYRRILAMPPQAVDSAPQTAGTAGQSEASVEVELAALRQEVAEMRTDIRVLVAGLKQLGLPAEPTS